MVDITKEVFIRRRVISKWNKSLCNVTKTSYFDSIPLDKIFESLKQCGVTVIQEDGLEWCGFLCGSTGSAKFRLAYEGKVVSNSVLILNWYGSEVHGLKGKVEINAYLS